MAPFVDADGRGRWEQPRQKSARKFPQGHSKKPRQVLEKRSNAKSHRGEEGRLQAGPLKHKKKLTARSTEATGRRKEKVAEAEACGDQRSAVHVFVKAFRFDHGRSDAAYEGGAHATPRKPRTRRPKRAPRAPKSKATTTATTTMTTIKAPSESAAGDREGQIRTSRAHCPSADEPFTRARSRF